MSSIRYLLIGGGLACHEAAKMLRQQDPDGGIVLVGDEMYPPYNRPPLTKDFLRGDTSKDGLLFEAETFYESQRIELQLGQPVDQLDLSRKTAILADGTAFRFDKALLATGGRPVRPDLPGTHLDGVQTLRTLDDAASLAARVQHGAPAVVVGAGFIGMEIAATLNQLGMAVTVVDIAGQVWPRFVSAELAAYFQDYAERRGIVFELGTSVTAFQGGTQVSSVTLHGGRDLPCRLACVGVGIRPNVSIARDAGLAIDDGIIVDACQRTSHPDVYAAGDVCNYPDPIFGVRRRVEHWGHAEYTGQLAGVNMAGVDMKYDLLTYVWSDFFDLHIEFAGNESIADQTVVRRDPATNRFTALYLKNHRLVAYLAVNEDKAAFPVWQKLIRSGRDLEGQVARLADPGVDVQAMP